LVWSSHVSTQLFHSSFSFNEQQYSIPHLRAKMLDFFPPLLARMDMNDSDLLTTMDGTSRHFAFLD